MPNQKQVVFISVLFVSLLFLSLLSTDLSAQVTLQSCTLPPSTPQPWMLEYSASYVWFSGSSGGKGYVVRVDTATVLADPVGATKSWEVAPSTHPETTSGYAVSMGVTVGGGYIWVGSQYSGGDNQKTELISRFNPLTLAVDYFWLPMEAKSIRAIRYDAGFIWIAASRILKLDPSKPIGVGNPVSCTDRFGAYDLLLDNGNLWVTSASGGVKKMDKISFALTSYSPSSPPNLMAKDALGNIWFSMNQNQKIGKLIASTGVITEYSLGIPLDPYGHPYDAPYGLLFDMTGQLWVAAYKYRWFLRFDPVSSSVVQTIASSNEPYYPVKDLTGNIWCWGQGSVEMNELSFSQPTTIVWEKTQSIFLVQDGTSYFKGYHTVTFSTEVLGGVATTVTATKTVTETRTTTIYTSSPTTTTTSTTTTLTSGQKIATKIDMWFLNPMGIAGKLTDLSGAPIKGMPVGCTMYVSGGSVSVTCITDKDGNFGMSLSGITYPEGASSYQVVFAGTALYLPKSASGSIPT